jgi:hypothetical protein
LLILDCCFAAQAGRGTDRRPGQVELIAAAAMGMKTPMPGPGSFTRTVIKEMRDARKTKENLTTLELHRRLVDRRANLVATPVYVKLTPKPRTIKLEPFPEVYYSGTELEPDGPLFQLLVRTNAQLDQPTITEISEWLGSNIPPTVTTVRAHSVLETTVEIQRLIEDITQGQTSLANALDKPALEDIMAAWGSVTALIEQNKIHLQNSPHEAVDKLPLRVETKDFIEKLEAKNSAFLDTAELNILLSSTDDGQIESALHDDTIQKLGIANHLRLRRIVTLHDGEIMKMPDKVPADTKSDLPVLQEFKEYGPYLNPAELPDLKARVNFLAQILATPKSPDYLSMRCRGWHHEPLMYRFVLEFDIQQNHEAELNAHQNLQSIIRTMKGADRPSLNQRFCIALKLAKAVQKWHSVGWLHQGISSPNVIFFMLKGIRKLDYSSPFLQGFEFARPDADPSIGRPADDILASLYRHPDRKIPERKGHRKIHDLYSLGVVLLEIGLWQSIVDIVQGKSKQVSSPEMVRYKIQVAISDRLGHYVGKTYQAAVNVCLNSDFGVELDDRQESRLARAFQKKVIDEIGKGVLLQG